MRRSLILVLALLTLTIAQAEAAPSGLTTSQERIELAQSEAGFAIDERYTARVTDAALIRQNATWLIFAPGSSPKPIVELDRNGSQVSIDPARINMTSGASQGLQAYHVDLKGLLDGAVAGDTVTLRATSTATGQTYRHVVLDRAEVLVFATARSGYAPSVQGIPAFQSIGDNRYHAIATDVSPSTEFSVSFVPTSATPPEQDLNLYLMFLVGLLAGIVIMLFAARKGWIGGSRAKKYVRGGELESRDLLEARRRTLMAALKELELAHESKEIPDAAYAPLKEEYKAQAVRVLRNLEEKREPPR